MSKDILIGVDGGGSQCTVRIEDAQGALLGHATVGESANIRFSVEGAWQSIFRALDEVLHPLAIRLDDSHYQFHAGIGLAGCEMKVAYQAFLDQPHPFKTLLLCSDAHTACLGAHLGQDGAIIIIGTGIVGYKIAKGGHQKVSGWGFPHGDEGSGAWLGLEAARLTCQWLDQRVATSPLVEAVFSFFNRDREYFIHWMNTAHSREFARLAPLVIHHSEDQEPSAQYLMKQAAHAVDQIGAVLLNRVEEPLPCCLYGGIAPFLEPWLSDALRAHLVVRKGGADVGALLMVKSQI